MAGTLARQATVSVGLRSRRFQGDEILELVSAGLLTLKRGRRGPQIDAAVKRIQRALIDAGFTLPGFGPDGVYGAETEAAVKGFQASKGLPLQEQDGKVGPITMGLLDVHFASGPGPVRPSESELGGPQFEVRPPIAPRYSGDAFVERVGDALRLNGPSFAFLAQVFSEGDSQEVDRWDIGHVQDIVEGIVLEGTYSDGHTLSFIAPVPIRDEARGAEPIFPWYRSDFVRPARNTEVTVAPHLDDPHVQFPEQDQGATLQRIHMRFKATDWVVARNRNVGDVRILHHARWGFDLEALFDSGGATPSPTPTGPSIIIGSLPEFPEPVGTVDPIEEGSGAGETQPSFTEAVFNEAAQFVSS